MADLLSDKKQVDTQFPVRGRADLPSGFSVRGICLIGDVELVKYINIIDFF